jgi:hypothetical protein
MTTPRHRAHAALDKMTDALGPLKDAVRLLNDIPLLAEGRQEVARACHGVEYSHTTIVRQLSLLREWTKEEGTDADNDT